MPIWHDEYRGYRISYQGDRHAMILPPGSETPIAEMAEAEAGEGRVELREKAHAIIDSHALAKRAALRT